MARTIGMIFDKPSTRTRVSFSAGMAQLGGTALALPTGEMQLGRGNRAGPDAIVMHDLTARYGEEITEGVLHGPRSAAPDQAENRMHAKKTLLALAIG